MSLYVSSTRRTAYHGRAADVFVVARSRTAATRHGERVVVMTWLDPAHEANGGHPAGTVVVRHMRGDGRTNAFEFMAEVVNVADPMAWAAERLTAP